MKIQFYTTGGTIDKIYFDQTSSYQVGDTYLHNVLLKGNVTFDYGIDEICRKDSLDLTDADRMKIVEAVRHCPEDRIVITHGTDAMTVTGQLLKSIQDKCIVLTGSMQPARFAESDAVFNIGTAVAAVQSLPPGVYITMNGQIFDPELVRKNVGKRRFERITHIAFA